MDYEKYELWLVDVIGLSKRSAKDVASRTRRASKVINLNMKCDDDTLLDKLSKKDEFLSWSMSVKSQIRRAIVLYRKFNSR